MLELQELNEFNLDNDALLAIREDIDSLNFINN